MMSAGLQQQPLLSLSSFVSICGERLDKKATIVSFPQSRSSSQRRQRTQEGLQHFDS